MTFSVVASRANQFPTIEPILPQTCQVGQTLTVSFAASDPDNEPLAVSALSNNTGVALVNVLDSFTLEVQCVGEGTATITVSVSDPQGATASMTFDVNASRLNQSPTIDPVAPQTCEVGQGVPIAINPGDPDGDPVSVAAFSDNEGVAQVVVFDNFNLTVNCLSAGGVTVTVNVDDGRGGVANTSFGVTVNEGFVPPPVFDVTAYPTLPDIGELVEALRPVYENGVFNQGKRNNVFSAAGDDPVNSVEFLDDLASGNYDLGNYGALQPVIDFYNAQPAHDALGDPAMSFNVQSAATGDGWTIEDLFNPNVAPDFCAPGETPLDCELRLSRPSVLFVSFSAANATATPPDVFRANLQQVVNTALAGGVIPVLATIPDDGAVDADTLAQYNQAMVEIALESEVPLWNLYATMQEAPAGVYAVGGFGPGDFSDAALTAGVNRRNLHTLFILQSIQQTLFP
jgi:hypothetical protein